MRPGFCKRLQFYLLMSSLCSFACACRDASIIDIRPMSSALVLPESIEQPQSIEHLQDQIFQALPLIDNADTFPSAWIKYTVPNIDAMDRPALMLGLCSSVDRVVWGNQLLVDFNLQDNSSLNPSKSYKPYLLLPMQGGPQNLYLRVMKSLRTGLRPACRELIVGPEESIAKQFVIFQAIETMTGTITIFMAIFSALLWLFKRQTIMLSFSAFSACIGCTFFFGSHPVHFALPGFPKILHLWNISLLLTPSSFLAFFYLILPVRIPLFRSMAIVNLLPLLIAILLISSGYEKNLGHVNQIFYQALGPQIVLTILVSLRLLIRGTFSQVILAVGLFILLSGAALDVATFLFNWNYYQGTSIGLIFFMGFLLTYLIQLYIEKEKELETERTQGLEDYSLKLAHEVGHRSHILQLKTDELEQSNSNIEEKNILLSISHKRLEDLIEQKDALLKKVAEISRDSLPKLNSALKQFYEIRDKETLQNLSIEVHRIASQLEPVARLHSTSESLTSRVIWLLEPEEQRLIGTKMTLGGSRVEIKSFLNSEEFAHSLSLGRPDLAVISTDFKDIPPLLHSSAPKIATVLTTRQELSQHIDLLTKCPSLCHVIYQDDEERTFTQKNLLVTVTKILSNDIFGLEKYLNWGVDVKEHIITSSNNRAKFLELVETELTKAGILTSVIRNATLITDEILMNAIYDAPVNRKTGLSKYNHLSRRVMVDLEPNEYGKLRFACDGSTIALSVDDPFGALKRETITRYLKSCFDGDFGKINAHEGKGGGGMGLFQIISTADLMITNVKPGERTEIIALIDVSGKSQAKKRHGSFHYFVES